jgi:hypothetical protein
MKEGGAESELDFRTFISGNGLWGQVLRPRGPEEGYHGLSPTEQPISLRFCQSNGSHLSLSLGLIFEGKRVGRCSP